MRSQLTSIFLRSTSVLPDILLNNHEILNDIDMDTLNSFDFAIPSTGNVVHALIYYAVNADTDASNVKLVEDI